jgi:hypothetical protein
MYKEHMPAIRDAMRAGVKVFRRGVMFAVCSIRQPTINVPGQLGILFDGEEGENPLFGHKFNAWAYINDEEKCAALWQALRGDYVHTHASCQEAVLALLRVPGLGIVKATFIAQLMGFDVACLDARNVAREGRNPRAYRTDGRKETRTAGLPGLAIRF